MIVMSPPTRSPKLMMRSVIKMKSLTVPPVNQMIKTSAQALKMAEQLSEFADFQGHEELSNVLLKVNDILRDLRFIREPRKQTYIDKLFTPS